MEYMKILGTSKMGLFYANHARRKKDGYIEQTWIFEDEYHFFHTLKINVMVFSHFQWVF